MALATGTRLGPYAITASVGAGGMGEVYKATDTRLDRTVAIKVLPEHVASDPDLKQRFEREAKTLAALSHPHICPVFDVGSQSGTDFLVMEYLEGETLEQRVKKGSLSLDQALQIGIQIADALAAAHRAGIVHRDLKPGNIMLTKSGAKLLDFGLAKTAAPAAAGSLSMLPTTPPNLTAEGAILGTFQYMAPEQLEGHEADARTDIFAFGAVFYEVITGKKAFEGKSQASLIAAILERDPPAVSSVRPLASPALEHIVQRCLAKSPDDRWQTARDLVHELRWIGGPKAPDPRLAAITPKPSHSRALLTALAITSLGCVALLVPAMNHWLEVPTVVSEIRFQVEGSPRFDDVVAISPDGRMLAFDGLADGKWQLWIRSLDSLAARSLPGTDGAIYPFWSPDSRSLGFFADGRLKRISIDGGPAQPLATAPEARGGTWAEDGTIVFAPAIDGPLYRVASSGGIPQPATRLQPGQSSHRFPSFLPGGRHVLYLTQATGTPNGVAVSALDGSIDKRLFDADGAAVYSTPGLLLFRRQQALLAWRFDLAALDAIGDPFAVADRVGGGLNFGATTASVARNGTLAFRAAPTDTGGVQRLAWFDRSGRELGQVKVGELSGRLNSPELSPRGDRVALFATMSGNIDAWIVETGRGVASRLTADGAADQWPIWSPDEAYMVFASTRKGSFDLFRVALRGNSPEESLLENPGTTVPTSWSSDGRHILYTQLNPQSGYDLLVLSLAGDRRPVPFATRMYDEVNGHFSKDMRWVAYESNETGRFEIVVQTYPAPNAKWQISTAGGRWPRWRDDGKEVFYVTPDGTLMGVPISVSSDGTSIQPGTPVTLVRGIPILPQSGGARGPYSVAPDGQRFLIVVPVDQEPTPITVVMNWAGATNK